MQVSTRPHLIRLLTLIVGGLVLFVFACGSGADSPRGDSLSSDGTTSHEESHETVVHIPTRWAIGNARDLRTLLTSSGTVFVGQVVELQETRLDDPFGGSLPSDDRPRVPVSIFTVRVGATLVGDAAAGSTVIVEQPGGVTAGPDGRPARFVLGGDEPLAVGTRYLFFAATKGNGNFSAAPFGRFEVSADGTLAAAPEWAELGAVKKLEGLRVEEARRQIARVDDP